MIIFAASALLAAQAGTPPPGDAPVGQQQIVVVGRRPVTADRIVCRTIVETGSRIPEGRQCQRESEWEQERRRNQETIERQVADSRDYNQQLVAHDSGGGPP
jgi:hypothetical protein